MVKGIDHVVIAVKDLDLAINSYRQLGFTVVPGGRHAGLGTSNALIAFADSAYLELIAFTPPYPHRLTYGIQRSHGTAGWSISVRRAMTLRLTPWSSAAPELQSALRLLWSGYGPTDTWFVGRSRPPKALHVASYLSFSDATPRDERVPRDLTHRNGVIGINSLAVAVSNKTAIAAIYANALGIPGAPIDREDLAASGICFMFGQHQLHLLEPKGPGVIADHIEMRGPSPFEIRLNVSSGKVHQLDHAATLGARLVLG